MNILAELSIFPIGKGESVSRYVARAVKIIRESGLPHRFGPMATAIEGEWEDVMEVVRLCFEDMKNDCDRIYLNLKIDYRRGREDALEGKMRAVESRLESGTPGEDA